MDRVVSILEQARASVARSVNSTLVIAYWRTNASDGFLLRIRITFACFINHLATGSRRFITRQVMN
jgi:hypothetical protein